LKYSRILGGHTITRDQSPEDLVIFREILQQLQTDISKLTAVSENDVPRVFERSKIPKKKTIQEMLHR